MMRPDGRSTADCFFSATMIIVGLVCWMTSGLPLVAQNATPPAASGAPNGDKSEANPLAADQAQVAERFKRLESLLLKSAEIEAASNPTRAALLQQAAQMGKQAQLSELLAKAAKSLEQNQYSQAVENQKISRDNLQRLLELLQSENRQDRVREQRDQVRRWIEEADRLRRLQSSLRGRTEGGGQTEQAASDQQKLADKAGQIAKELDGDQPDKQANENDSANKDAESKDDSASKDTDGKDGKSADQDKKDPKQTDSQDANKNSDGKPTGEQKNADQKSDTDNKNGDNKNGDDKNSDNKNSDKKNGNQSDKDSQAKEPKDKAGQPNADKPSEKDQESKNSPGESNDKPPEGSKSEGKSDQSKKPSDANQSKPQEPGQSQDSQSQDSQSQDSQSQDSQSQDGQSQQSQSSEQQQPQQPQSPTERAAQRIKQAQKRMQEAQKQLEDAKRKDAVDKQREAEQELQAAIEQLEEILRQLREEEIERSLAALEDRLRSMLQAQNKVFEETKRLQDISGANNDRSVEIRASNLAGDERKILGEGQRALLLLREEGTSAAFPEAMSQILTDVQSVADRLAKADTGKMTVAIEQEIITSLEELIEALVAVQKEQKNRKEQKQSPGQQQQGDQGDQPLVDQLAEMRLIKTLQLRVNKRTDTLSAMLKDPNDVVGQADAEDIATQIRELSQRQASITQVTRDIVIGKNK